MQAPTDLARQPRGFDRTLTIGLLPSVAAHALLALMALLAEVPPPLMASDLDDRYIEFGPFPLPEKTPEPPPLDEEPIDEDPADEKDAPADDSRRVSKSDEEESTPKPEAPPETPPERPRRRVSSTLDGEIAGAGSITAQTTRRAAAGVRDPRRASTEGSNAVAGGAVLGLSAKNRRTPGTRETARSAGGSGPVGVNRHYDSELLPEAPAGGTGKRATPRRRNAGARKGAVAGAVGAIAAPGRLDAEPGGQGRKQARKRTAARGVSTPDPAAGAALLEPRGRAKGRGRRANLSESTDAAARPRGPAGGAGGSVSRSRTRLCRDLRAGGRVPAGLSFRQGRITSTEAPGAYVDCAKPRVVACAPGLARKRCATARRTLARRLDRHR